MTNDGIMMVFFLVAAVAAFGWALWLRAQLTAAHQQRDAAYLEADRLRTEYAEISRQRDAALQEIDRLRETTRRLPGPQPADDTAAALEELRERHQQAVAGINDYRRQIAELQRRLDQRPEPEAITVAQPEPEIPLDGDARESALRDPQALPNVPDGVPDSLLDGARFGTLCVRAASVRGDSRRQAAKIRRQAMSLAVLDLFHPPTLLSAVAVGGPAVSRYAQVAAAQVCRSIRYKIADRAGSIEQAWQGLDAGDPLAAERLAAELRSALADLTGPLTDAAATREPGRAFDAELTCLLTRLGDGAARRHVAFGVGSGPVLKLDTSGTWSTVFSPLEQADGPGRPAVLPAGAGAMRWAPLTTAPGELLVLCTGSTAALLEREPVRSSVTDGWGTAPPPLTRFLWQLNLPDPLCRDDRTAVGLWELPPRLPS